MYIVLCIMYIIYMDGRFSTLPCEQNGMGGIICFLVIISFKRNILDAYFMKGFTKT